MLGECESEMGHIVRLYKQDSVYAGFSRLEDLCFIYVKNYIYRNHINPGVGFAQEKLLRTQNPWPDGHGYSVQ